MGWRYRSWGEQIGGVEWGRWLAGRGVGWENIKSEY